MLNKYLDRLYLLIAEYRKQTLSQFEGTDGKRADFDDLIWFYIDPNSGRKTRFLCGRHGAKGSGNAGNKPEFALPYPYSHLVKVWIIEVINEPISVGEKQARVSIARKLLSVMEGELYAQTDMIISGQSLPVLYEDRLRPFITFCLDKGLVRQPEIKGTFIKDRRDRTGNAEFDNNIMKLPPIESLIALGSIFTKVFKHVNEDGSEHKGEQVNITDAWIVTFALAGLASPSRLAAEVPVLPKQRLKTYAEGDGESVHYLDWIGSKGFHDNKTHVLGALAAEFEKAINFFFIKCEPIRILSRFYENPQLSLNALLGDFKVAEERKKVHLNFNKPPNLFTLGYVLGFYEIEDYVSILKSGVDLSSVHHAQRGQFFENKPIHALTLSDRLSMSLTRKSTFSSLPFLFGYDYLSKRIADDFSGALTATVGEIQDWWIEFFKRTILPEFPNAYTSSESSIRLADALFCLRGDWVYARHGGRGSGGKAFQASLFALVPLSSLGSLAGDKLTGTKLTLSIFEDYGFSRELAIRSHSLRHFGNTLADLSNIPHEIITAWSGRRSSEQTTTYIHTSHEERADRVRVILNKPENDSREIRVVAQEDLIQRINIPASITSTGICTQDLNVTPCDYLNDLVSQCFMCPEACYIAGDVKAIELFEKDCSYQKSRLEAVSIDRRLSVSQAMQRWYVIHSRNTYILSQLLNLMKTSQEGTVIRFSAKKYEFYLSNPQTKAISNTPCVLPDFDGLLQGLIENRSEEEGSNPNPQLQSLLSSFGLSEEGT